jgi:hypothetical protein
VLFTTLAQINQLRFGSLAERYER